jgi:hypothetical protein
MAADGRRALILALVAGAALHGACAARAKPPAASAPAFECGEDVAGREQLTAPLVLLGEIHGTSEIPAVFGRLVCRAAEGQRSGSILVGLEIFTTAQPALDAFLDSDGGPRARAALLEADFWQREYQDGRSSRAMLELLEQIRRQRAAGLKVVVRAIDPPDWTSPGERDARMAEAIQQSIDAVHPARTYVMVGNVHSRALKGYPWNPAADYLPMGARLRETHPDLIALDTAYAGSAWTCTSAQAKDCGVHDARSRQAPAGPTPRLVLDPEAFAKAGHHGMVFVGAVTAAAPARSSF